MSAITSTVSSKKFSLRLFGPRDYLGGLLSLVLIALGAVSLFMGVSGGNTVNHEISLQQITGSGDMTPAAIKGEATKAGLKGIEFPTCSVANVTIKNGSQARCFAQYMRIHTLEATHGMVYSQMGRFAALPTAPKSALTPDGATNDAQYAQVDPKSKQPVDNGLRNLWVTETALTTALNTSYMASQLALFGIAVGLALLVTGIGLGVAGYRRKGTQS